MVLPARIFTVGSPAIDRPMFPRVHSLVGFSPSRNSELFFSDVTSRIVIEVLITSTLSCNHFVGRHI
jgi:hypothetical protein